MKFYRYLLAALIYALPTAAFAQCSGLNTAGSVCGNPTAASAFPSATRTPVLGLPGTAVGTLSFGNATSGTVKLQPVTGALGTSVLSLPATTGTLATTAGASIPSGTTSDILFFSAPNVLSASQTLPAAVQTNITQLGTLTGVPALVIAQTGLSSTIATTVYKYNSITVTGDALNLNGGVSDPVTYGFNVDFTTGGLTSQGHKVGIGAILKHTSASSQSVYRDHVALNGRTEVSASDGGTDTGSGAKGAFFGGGMQAFASAGATNLFGLVGAEITHGLLAGSSAKNKYGLLIADQSTLQAAGNDHGLSIASTTVGYKTGIAFNGSNALTASSTAIGQTGEALTVLHGIDFAPWNITGYLLRGANASISGAGNLVLASTGGSSITTNLPNIFTSPSNTAAVTILSGASNFAAYMQVGRTATEAALGVPGTASDFLTGTAPGDLALKSTSGSVWFGVGTTPGWKISAGGALTAPQLGLGLLHSSAGGAITSSAVNLASADVTGDLPFSNLAQGSALSVLGVAGNSTADVASIAAASDNQIMRRSGTAIAFGSIDLSQSNAVGSSILARANGGSGTANGPVVTVKKQVFTGSGTYTPSTGMLYAMVECVGGGAGGGGAAGGAGQNYSGGGGGSGGYSRLVATAATIGASQTVTIGAAGAGGSAGSNNGAAGGDASVGTLCIGKGGSGGSFGSVAQVPTAGAGGVAGTGDLAAAGNPGTPGLYAGILTVAFPSGNGGSSYFGGGAQGVHAGSGATTGANAGVYGSGGSGGEASNAAVNAAGGNGSAGVIFITEYNNQ